MPLETPLNDGTSFFGGPSIPSTVNSSIPVQPHSHKVMEEHWRIKDRLRTVAVGIILCLHLGVDPPDIHKTNPCARLECWTDPEEDAKAVENILRNIQQQFEFWHPKARYKTLMDPTTDEVRRLCQSLRKAAKEERVLLHYNGHGVPRPTKAGELWVFNKQFTQYIPVSTVDVASWLGGPVLVTVDCSGAANVVGAWHRMAEAGEDVLYLASCGAEELLPMAPEMPADIFTSCLTTPLEIAIRWHVYRGGPLMPKVTLEMAMSLPGRLNDRKTPLGELNWILTAITDTIAWCTLPRRLFQKLFRQDILVACLFRNYLLAIRILQSFNCTPLSYPPIPVITIARHELWNSWDMMLDYYLTLLTPPYIENISNSLKGTLPPHYDANAYFSSQMDTFSLWVDQQALHQGEMVHSLTHQSPSDSHNSLSCSLLPGMLQVLLSQAHRNRALTLLGYFMDLGRWAVRDSLQVGIFPYIIKLFQSPSLDIRYALLYLWLRVLVFDTSVIVELTKDNNFQYFGRALLDPVEETMDVFEMRSMAAACLCLYLERGGSGYSTSKPKAGDMSKADITPSPATTTNSSTSTIPDLFNGVAYLDVLLTFAQGASPLLSQWSLLLLTLVPDAIPFLLAHTAQIFPLLHHERCENRTAAICLLGRMAVDDKPDNNRTEDQLIIEIIYQLLGCVDECHPPARQELVAAFSRIVAKHSTQFTLAAYDLWLANNENNHFTEIDSTTLPTKATISSLPLSSSSSSYASLPSIEVVAPGAGDMVRNPSVFSLVWKACLMLAMDPCEEIAQMAAQLVDEIHMGFIFRRSTHSLSSHHQSTFNEDDSNHNPKARTESIDRVTRDFGKLQIDTLALTQDESNPSLISPSSTNSSLLVVLPSVLPFTSQAISLAAAHLIQHQHHRREMLLRRNAHPVYAKLKKVNLVQSLDPRRWRDLDISHRRFDQQWAGIRVNMTPITTVLFHPLEDLLLVTNQKGEVSIWDFSKRFEEGLEHDDDRHDGRHDNYQSLHRRDNYSLLHRDDSHQDLHRDNNQTPCLVKTNDFQATTGSRTFITGIACVDWDPIKLLVGTSDGIVRLYKDFEWGPAAMIAAWSTTTTSGSSNVTNQPMKSAMGEEIRQCTLLEFNQHQRKLFTVTGGAELAVLDAAREQIMQRIILPHVPATSLTSDRKESPIVTIGFAYGWIKRYDLRQGERAIATFREADYQAIMGVRQSFQDHELVSGSAGASLTHWDLRHLEPALRVIDGELGMPLTALDQHPQAHLQVIGGGSSMSKREGIVCWWEGDYCLQRSKEYGTSSISERLGPIQTLTVHPRKMMTAVGCSDGIVALYSSSFKED